MSSNRDKDDQTHRLVSYLKALPLDLRVPATDLAYSLAQARTDAMAAEAIASAEAAGDHQTAQVLRDAWDRIKKDRKPTADTDPTAAH
jgi:hypothetical protein